ncbi:MAG: hypothetical protein DMF89_24155 [Acidobacteria bacterium]|nr:MAG: hypothetical protein DMF89_24155 [Acidobacteriota bacterium]
MHVTVLYRRTTVSVLWAALLAWPTAGAAQTYTQPDQCDFMTSAGWLNTTAHETHPLAKATFAVAGGCKDGSVTWGHLDYTDEGNGLNVTSTSITAYIWGGNDGADPKTGRAHGTRFICGTATTNLFGDVDFGVMANDGGEPRNSDGFIIRLRNKAGSTVYMSENPQEDFTLGSSGSSGGNIQLHTPSGGSFGGSCPAFFQG